MTEIWTYAIFTKASNLSLSQNFMIFVLVIFTWNRTQNNTSLYYTDSQSFLPVGRNFGSVTHCEPRTDFGFESLPFYTSPKSRMRALFARPCVHVFQLICLVWNFIIQHCVFSKCMYLCLKILEISQAT